MLGMLNRVVVIGASAGGFHILKTVLGALDHDLNATVLVVLHIAPTSPGMLVPILQKVTPLKVQTASDQNLAPGHIFVAPPDQHLLVERGFVRTTRGAKENYSRPAIDVLFRSAALAYGNAVIGVVLSGALDDGTAGLFYIKRHGGIAVVQDPKDAEVPSMPKTALTYVDVDFALPAKEIGGLINRLVKKPCPSELPASGRGANLAMKRLFVRSPDVGPSEAAILEEDERSAQPSVFTCPDCSGTLFGIKDGKLERYRCRIGHAYGLESLLDGQPKKIEAALSSAAMAAAEEIDLLQEAKTAALRAEDRAKVDKLESQIARAKTRLSEIERLSRETNC